MAARGRDLRSSHLQETLRLHSAPILHAERAQLLLWLLCCSVGVSSGSQILGNVPETVLLSISNSILLSKNIVVYILHPFLFLLRYNGHVILLVSGVFVSCFHPLLEVLQSFSVIAKMVSPYILVTFCFVYFEGLLLGTSAHGAVMASHQKDPVITSSW